MRSYLTMLEYSAFRISEGAPIRGSDRESNNPRTRARWNAVLLIPHLPSAGMLQMSCSQQAAGFQLVGCSPAMLAAATGVTVCARRALGRARRPPRARTRAAGVGVARATRAERDDISWRGEMRRGLLLLCVVDQSVAQQVLGGSSSLMSYDGSFHVADSEAGKWQCRRQAAGGGNANENGDGGCMQ